MEPLVSTSAAPHRQLEEPRVEPVPDGPEKRLPARCCGCNRLENVNRGDNDPAGVVHRAKITFSVLEILGTMYIKVIRFARGCPATLTSTSHPFVQFYLL